MELEGKYFRNMDWITKEETVKDKIRYGLNMAFGRKIQVLKPLVLVNKGEVLR